MRPNWRHGIAAGIMIFSFFAIYLLFKDASRENLSSDNTNSPNISTGVIEEITEPKIAPIELPFGGRELLPNYRFVALYGSGEYRGLGSLGEQSLKESIGRVKELATTYQKFSEEKIIPTFEIIATVAAADLTSNDDYSREMSVKKLQPWVDAAKTNNMYVLLDLQPGRSTFLTQAKLYESLLIEPHVGLALDPEWRLQKPTDRHLISIGSVSAAEVNETSKWLADLTKKHDLPQKMFMVHQFKLSMITERETLQTSREELAYVLHMDGHGAPGSKTRSWNTIKENLPKNIYLGWKNFYDEDKPTPTPKLTMQQTPKPWFISYQ